MIQENCSVKGCGKKSTRYVGRKGRCETHWKEYRESLCAAHIWENDGTYRRCERPATMERDGHRVCWQHGKMNLSVNFWK